MAINDYGIEALKKSAELVDPNSKADTYFKTRPQETEDNLFHIVDVQNSQLSFDGWALDNGTSTAGPDTSSAIFKIRRTLTQGKITKYQWAVNSDNKVSFDQVWDDRDNLFPDVTLTNPASLKFNGTSDEVTFGDNYTFGPATAFSWGTWLYSNNFASTRSFISKASQDANVYGYNFGHDTNGDLRAQMRAPSTLRSHTFTASLSPLTWYHVVFTYAGGSNINGLKCYLDGSLLGTASSGTLNSWTVTDPLTLGSRGQTFYFSGNMNQPAVINKELSSSEVSEWYSGGNIADLNTISFTSNILSWWFFNTADNFPNEIDQIGSVNGTLDSGMSESSYESGNVP